jgi:ribosomal protein S18 acetylase RimI-like enzyme
MSDAPLPHRFALSLEGEVRVCAEADLEALEWHGMFTPHRALIRDAFARQQRGEVVMLVADIGGFPAGQVWIDLDRRADAGVGYLWALRVLPVLYGKGVGTRLVAAAEGVLRDRGFDLAEIGVETENTGARRLYERLGYRVVREEHGSYEYDTPDGEHFLVPMDEWILQKPL